MTTCGAAIKNFEAKTGEVAAEAKIVKLYCQVPPIAKMDGSLNKLAACELLQIVPQVIELVKFLDDVPADGQDLQIWEG